MKGGLPLLARVSLLVGAVATGATCDAAAQRPRQGLLSLEDARIFYEVVGQGDPIVVVHGGPGLDHAYLRPGLDALAVRNTLVYYDQRGTGRSAAALEASTINLDAFIEDIEALRQALGYDRISVLAHSFGALIGIEYARRRPEAVRALILMNPIEPGSRFAEERADRARAARTAEDSTELAALTAGEGFAAGDPATVSAVLRIRFRQALRDPARVDELDLELAESTAKNGAEVARLLGESMGEVDWWDRLEEIGVPALVIHGRYDPLPLAMSRELAETLPLGRLSLLESGHFPYLEDPDGLLSAISAFFVDLSR
ncbi:MAG TPA: alpha/beta fold hydrolase [Longimicrobiales bacterium]|nr:alpha/beta fold hydrolase [Longimicrobiales bacterium]